MMHPQIGAKFRDKARGPQSSSHNPLDGLSGQPFELARNSTSPTAKEESVTTPENMENTSTSKHKNGESPDSGQLFNISTINR